MIKIATRQSVLALWQSEFIASKLADEGKSSELVGMKTKGDVVLDTPLAKIGGKGLFTKELEESMLRGETDIAVHSLKDVPTTFPQGLVLAAVCARTDARDAMLSQQYASFSELPYGAKIGTTSLRRRMQLLAMRPDLEIISLRGNVQTRIKKLKEGEFDAIILAMAGILRLGLKDEVKFIHAFDIQEMVPAMGQAALGIEAREDMRECVEFLNDPVSVVATTIERDFVHALNGGCQAPIGVHAILDGESVLVRAVLGMPDASEILSDVVRFDVGAYKIAGKQLADKFIARGARELLKKAEAMAAEII
ncbi:hydroxymethylbilane synthase [Campylobacter sp. 19-13652]|uniref:hydroxymethylbilane synthase n=1 Tax=Campylobacter sp. 19-13652 TaxID=2840180 RepID=UPI001C7523D1|nr:hydroxymethylbilane synthase [Campylobacter sp. 19-13652]BCX79207.1 porphobilinogen deaminase [Campylobacter sp. 19-13652]